jgi:hypothetical protein
MKITIESMTSMSKDEFLRLLENTISPLNLSISKVEIIITAEVNTKGNE